MKRYHSYDKAKCKKIIFNSISNNRVYFVHMIYGIPFFAIGFFLVIGKLINSSDFGLDKIFFTVLLYIVSGFVVIFAFTGILVLTALRSLQNSLYSKHVYNSIVFDNKLEVLRLCKKKQDTVINYKSIKQIISLNETEKELLNHVRLSINIKLEIIKIQIPEVDFYIVVDTIQDKGEFINTLNTLKEKQKLLSD